MSGPTRLTSASVAVLMPVRDGERYLVEAIDSILHQTTPPGEVVVVDDGSQDGTPALLARYGDALRVVHQAPSGQFVAMNRAVEVSASPVLAFLDADDLYTPASIERRLVRLNADDRPDAVFGRTEQFVSPELTPEQATELRFEAGPLRGELFGAMLIRRTAFARVGPLHTGRRTSSNIDWISRARATGLRSVEIDEVVARRRLHTTNIGRTAKDEKRADLLSVVRAHHRRAAGLDGSPGP